jgi:WD40 repeat protein
VGLTIYSWPALQKQREVAVDFSHSNDLVFSADGKLLAIAGGEPGESGGFHVFTWPTGEAQKPQRVLPDVAHQLAWLPGDQRLALAGTDGQLLLATLAGEIVERLQGHSRDVLCVAVSGDGKLLFSGSGDNSVRVWNARTGELLRTLNNHSGEVRDVAIRPLQNGLALLASSGSDKTIRFWQPTIGRMVRFLRLESAPLAIDWTPDGRCLLAACEDGWLRVIDPDELRATNTLATLDGWAYAVAASPDGNDALVGGELGNFRKAKLTSPSTN